MHKQRLVLIVASLIGAISTFLPWLTNLPPAFKAILGDKISEDGSITGAAGSDGYISLVLFIILIIIALIGGGNRTWSIRKGARTGAIVVAIIVTLFSVWKLMSAMSATDDMKKLFGGSIEPIGVGMGIYLLVLSSVVSLIAIFGLGSKSADQ